MPNPLQRVVRGLAPRVDVDVAGLELVAALRGPVVLAANHPSPVDRAILNDVAPRRWRVTDLKPRPALLLGLSPLVFCEGGVSPDGSLGEFNQRAADAAHRAQVPLVPVVIRGTHPLSKLPARSIGDRPREVLVRFGEEVLRAATVEETTVELRAVLEQLLAEDGSSWWRTLTRGPQSEQQPSGSWRTGWLNSAEARRPGAHRRPTIWS